MFQKLIGAAESALKPRGRKAPKRHWLESPPKAFGAEPLAKLEFKHEVKISYKMCKILFDDIGGRNMLLSR